MLTITSNRFSSPRNGVATLLPALTAILWIFVATVTDCAAAANSTATATAVVPARKKVVQVGLWRTRSDFPGGVVRRLEPATRGEALFRKGSVALEDASDLFLEKNREILGLAPLLDDLEVAEIRGGIATDHVIYRRVVDGYPVEPARVGVHWARDGRLLAATVGIDPRLPATTAKTTIARVAAIEVAVGKAIADGVPVSDLVWIEEQERLRLVWRVRYFSADPIGDWDVTIDAYTGEVIERHDRRWLFDGEGTVWIPNPVQALGTENLSDRDDADHPSFNNAYRTVVLRDLDDPDEGVYSLDGPWVRIADHPDELPAVEPPVSATGDFNYSRANDSFEAVMVYYHIDAGQRYLQSIGFENVVAFAIDADPHGLSGDDNSHYVPSARRLAFGDGCVDDAEDADVIVHEYGHAIHDSQAPGWDNRNFMGAMGEGFGDYWAESYAQRTGVSFGLGQVFDWDRGPVDGCWAGRRVDGDKVYPGDYIGSIHTDGEIWSSSLWDLRQEIGEVVADQVIIESHFAITPSSSVDFETAALAILDADEALNNGANSVAIFDVFFQRGILDETGMPPVLSDPVQPESLFEGQLFTASITVGGAGDSAMTPVANADLVYGADEAPATELALSAGDDGLYSVSFQTPLGVDTLYYYYRIIDALDRTVTSPAGAPVEHYRTAIVPDDEPPTISHTPLSDVFDSQFPVIVRASVSDNLGIDPAGVLVECTHADSPGDTISFALTDSAGNGNFSATFPDNDGRVGVYRYRIAASDLSIAANQSHLPSDGMFEFAVHTDSVGPVIEHTPAGEVIAQNEPLTLFVTIGDNGALDPDSLYIEFSFVGEPRDTSGIAPLMETTSRSEFVAAGLYSASIPRSADQSGVLSYAIVAVDAAVGANRTRMPETGYHDVTVSLSRFGVIAKPNVFPTGDRDDIDFELQLPERATAILEIYDISGRRVAELMNAMRDAGTSIVSWDGMNDNGDLVAPGIYFYRLESKGRESTGRVVHLGERE